MLKESSLYASISINSIQSRDYEILAALEREWKGWQDYRMCYHAKVSSYYLRYPEIWYTL